MHIVVIQTAAKPLRTKHVRPRMTAWTSRSHKKLHIVQLNTYHAPSLIPRANGFVCSHTQKSQCVDAEWQTWWRHSITKRQTFSAAASRQSWACKALPAPRSKRELRLRRRMQFDVHLAARLVPMTWIGTPATMPWADRYVGLGSWESAWCRSVGL